MGLVATYIIPPTLSIILFYLGWRVSPEEGEGREGGMDPLGHGHVGQQHELLDQLVGLVVLDDLGTVGPAVLVAVDLDLLHV